MLYNFVSGNHKRDFSYRKYGNRRDKEKRKETMTTWLH